MTQQPGDLGSGRSVAEVRHVSRRAFSRVASTRSKAEYIAKLNGGIMELEETLYWLELMVCDHIVPEDDAYVEWLWDEARQLIAILFSLINKWKGE